MPPLPRPHRHRAPWPLVLIVPLAALLACDGDDDDDDTTSGGLLPAEVIEGLVYAGAEGGSRLAGDLYLPERSEPPPVFLMVHGGGFFQGERADLEVAAGHLQRAGIAVFNVDYRLVGVDGGEYPAAVVDVLDAVRYLNANREELGVAGACGTFGTSAGGTLAALAALLRDDPAMVRAGWSTLHGISDDVPLFAAASGVYDFTTREEQHGSVPPMEQDFLGGGPDEVPARYLDASPAQHAAGAAGPVLLLHGGQDSLVESVQADLMGVALQDAGVDVELVLYPEGIHGFMFPMNEHNPDGLDAIDRLATLFASAAAGCPAVDEGAGARVVQSGSATWDGQTWAGEEAYELWEGDDLTCELGFTTAGTAGEGTPPVARVTYTRTSESGDCAGAPFVPGDDAVWTLSVGEDTRDGQPALFRETDGLGLYRWFDVESTGDEIGYSFDAQLPASLLSPR